MRKINHKPKFSIGDGVGIFLQNNSRTALSGSTGMITDVRQVGDTPDFVYTVDTGTRKFGEVNVFQDSLVRDKNSAQSKTVSERADS